MRKLKSDELARPSHSEYEAIGKMPVVVVLDNIRSMNNVGSFFRTCDAFAVESIVLCGITATPPDREIHKTALGAEETVRWTYSPTTREAVVSLIADGYTPIAVEQTENATLLHNFLPESGRKYALVFGNEVNGVDQGVVDMCAGAIEIPQSGIKHSLNVAIAGGVVLWHFYSLWSAAPR